MWGFLLPLFPFIFSFTVGLFVRFYFILYLSHGNVIDRSGENCFLRQTKSLSLSFKIVEVILPFQVKS